MENEIKRNIETLCNQPEENRVDDDRLQDANGGFLNPSLEKWRCPHCEHFNDHFKRVCEKCGWRKY